MNFFVLYKNNRAFSLIEINIYTITKNYNNKFELQKTFI